MHHCVRDAAYCSIGVHEKASFRNICALFVCVHLPPLLPLLLLVLTKHCTARWHFCSGVPESNEKKKKKKNGALKRSQMKNTEE